LDVKSIFLNGTSTKEVCMGHQHVFAKKDNEHLVCRLRKALYGLKQSSRTWYSEIHSYFVQLGFVRFPLWTNLYVKVHDS
jgi:hypothetical protein